jgi:hypothetical protein
MSRLMQSAADAAHATTRTYDAVFVRVADHRGRRRSQTDRNL